MQTIIKHSDIELLKIKPTQYMEWVRYMLLNQYESNIPPKTSIPLPDNGFFNTMPCYIPKANVIGLKTVSRYVNNNPALDATIMLYNSLNGELLTIMDATIITAMRTGAVAATSILTLKNDNEINNLSIIGLGVTARASLLCLLDSSKNEKYRIKLMRYKDQAEVFIERFISYDNVEFEIVDTHKDLIVGADIILSCVTNSSQLIGEDSWFKEGVLLVPVHTKGFQNCDSFFDKVYGDLTTQISSFKYFDKFKTFNEFAKVIIGDDKGRESRDQRILVYNIGMAIHDIFIGNEIYKSIINSEVDVTNIYFKEKIDKFYI